MRVVMTSYTVTGSPPGRPLVGFAPESRGGAEGDDGSSERDGPAVGPGANAAAEINPPAGAAGAPSKAPGRRRAGGGGLEPPRLPLDPKEAPCAARLPA